MTTLFWLTVAITCLYIGRPRAVWSEMERITKQCFIYLEQKFGPTG